MINDEFRTWVSAHLKDDATKLRLKYSNRTMPFDVQLAILQIECRKKYKAKLKDTLASYADFIFPDAIAGEQATSDALADFHASLIEDGTDVLDLTAGLGIDALHCAQRAGHLVAIERREAAVVALRHNASLTDKGNIEVVSGDCHDYLASLTDEKFGTIFIDPARRDEAGNRIYALSDCQPNIVEMLPKVRQHCNQLIIKASPMLDISHTISELGDNVTRVIAIGTPSECKELVIVMDFRQTSVPTIEAVTVLSDGTIRDMTFTNAEEHNASAAFANPSVGDYVYEPYPSVIKAGAFKLLSQRFGTSKPHANTHLYHSGQLATDFPGDAYTIEDVLPYSSKIIKGIKKQYPRISVAVRNFGISAAALKTQLKVSDGGDLRLIGVTGYDNERYMLILKRLSLLEHTSH
jgi:hypothetical protein